MELLNQSLKTQGSELDRLMIGARRLRRSDSKKLNTEPLQNLEFNQEEDHGGGTGNQ